MTAVDRFPQVISDSAPRWLGVQLAMPTGLFSAAADAAAPCCAPSCFTTPDTPALAAMPASLLLLQACGGGFLCRAFCCQFFFYQPCFVFVQHAINQVSGYPVSLGKPDIIAAIGARVHDRILDVLSKLFLFLMAKLKLRFLQHRAGINLLLESFAEITAPFHTCHVMRRNAAIAVRFRGAGIQLMQDIPDSARRKRLIERYVCAKLVFYPSQLVPVTNFIADCAQKFIVRGFPLNILSGGVRADLVAYSDYKPIQDMIILDLHVTGRVTDADRSVPSGIGNIPEILKIDG